MLEPHSTARSCRRHLAKPARDAAVDPVGVGVEPSTAELEGGWRRVPGGRVIPPHNSGLTVRVDWAPSASVPTRSLRPGRGDGLLPPLELVFDVPDLPTSLAFGHSLDQIVVLFDRFQCRTMRRRALVPIMTKHLAAQPERTPPPSLISRPERFGCCQSDRGCRCLAEERLQIVCMTADLQPNDCRAANDACVDKQCPPGGNKEASDDENEPNSPDEESVECVSDLRDAGKGGAVVGQKVPAETAQHEYPSEERHSPPGDRSKHALDFKPAETDLRKTLEPL